MKPSTAERTTVNKHLERFTAAQGVVFIGRAQEKNTVFRTEKRRHPDGVTYPWIVKSTGIINQFYFYCVDSDFGPFFLKFSSYFPYNAKLCLNGHHWAQRQAAKAGIAFTAMDNAFAAVDDPAAVQAICDRLGPAAIQALLEKWLAILPNPFTEQDRQAGYRYQLSILQAEFSLTQMLDAPVTGRVFFEQVIRDNLDIGRPDQVSLIFDRRLMKNGPRQTPGRFRTRVITEGVTPSLHVDYKHTTIKQYHKESRALRTETTINDSEDFRIRKGLVNLPALREIGLRANRRLLGVQRLDHDPITGTRDLHTVTDPITTATGTRIPGLRLGQPRTHALLSALLTFRLQPDGFTNRDLRTLTADLRGLPPDAVTAGQMTYDLRRLRTHSLIAKIPHSHRYRVTDQGAYTPPCSLPACTTDCSPPDSRSSPTPTSHGRSGQLPTLTRQPSTNSPPPPVSQHDPTHPTQPTTNPTQNYGSAAFSPNLRDLGTAEMPADLGICRR